MLFHNLSNTHQKYLRKKSAIKRDKEDRVTTDVKTSTTGLHFCSITHSSFLTALNKQLVFYLCDYLFLIYPTCMLKQNRIIMKRINNKINHTSILIILTGLLWILLCTPTVRHCRVKVEQTALMKWKKAKSCRFFFHNTPSSSFQFPVTEAGSVLITAQMRLKWHPQVTTVHNY